MQHVTRPHESWDAEIATVRVLYGAGRLSELGKVVRGHGGRRALLVSDPGLRAAGHVDAALARLAEAGVETRLFDEVGSNPTEADVESGAAFARSGGEPPEILVALGGGSAMDAAKGINFLLTNDGPMERFWGFGKAERPLLPAVAVPTTAGTGSDAQSYALISRSDSGRKMACGDRSARFRTALLDPERANTAPRAGDAAAGIDALAHAVESFVTRVRTPVSSMLAREAWTLLGSSLESALAGGGVPVYGRLLLGAHLAGAAIEASMLGGAHAAANPLTARHGILHGVAVGMMLPAVVRHNSAVADDLYARLVPGGGAALARRLEELGKIAGLPPSLAALGLERGDLPALARAATDEWTGGYNPSPLSEGDFLKLYEQVL
ncbi:MAG: iron-containing alcohol dehydrogenase [Thermoanaerobaculia bacterium]|nr:iron-containing alcohol dehydrogenase [Thermoanaerobaculia bacterium]